MHINDDSGGYVEYCWTLWPEDVLDALDLLLVYVGLHDKLVRPGLHEPSKIGGEHIYLMRRALPSRALQAARSLLYLRYCHPANGGRRMHWFVPLKPRPSDRLTIAGLDIDTLEVTNKRRWAFAFQQIINPPYGFSQYKNIELDDSNLPTPELTPLNFSFKKAGEKKQPKKLITKEQKEVTSDHLTGPLGESFGARRPEY